MSNVEPSVLRRRVLAGNKRLWRLVLLVTAVALVAGTAVPADAAVRQPARTAPISLASSDDALPAVSLTAAAVGAGRLTLDTVNAERAGVGSQALDLGSVLVARVNKLLDQEAVTAGGVGYRSGVDVANVVPAVAQDTTITLLPGITLTISGTGIQLSMTKQAVTEVENLLGFGQSVASLVGAILAATGQVPLGSPIAAIVASSLGLGNSLLKLCTAGDGSATFTIRWFGLPSCSGLSLFA